MARSWESLQSLPYSHSSSSDGGEGNGLPNLLLTWLRSVTLVKLHVELSSSILSTAALYVTADASVLSCHFCMHTSVWKGFQTRLSCLVKWRTLKYQAGCPSEQLLVFGPPGLEGSGSK